MLCITELLLAGNIPKPLGELTLQWYYMLYHKSDSDKLVLSDKTLDDETIKSVMAFFQACFEQKKLKGTLKHQDAERTCRRLTREASEKLPRWLHETSNGRRSHHFRRKIAHCNN